MSMSGFGIFALKLLILKLKQLPLWKQTPTRLIYFVLKRPNQNTCDPSDLFFWVIRTQVLLRIQLCTSSVGEFVLKSLWDGNVVSQAAVSGKLGESLGVGAYNCQYLLNLLLLRYLVNTTELTVFLPRLSFKKKFSQQILWMYNSAEGKQAFIAQILQNNLCACWLISLSPAVCSPRRFLDDPLQIVASRSFLPFILETEQKGSILRQDCASYSTAFFHKSYQKYPSF